MAKPPKRCGRIATSYHENQFASSFDPLTRRHSLTDLSQDQLDTMVRQSTARYSFGSPTRPCHRTSHTMMVNYKSSSFSDKESRIILKELEGKHKEPKKARKLIYEQGEKMKRLTKEKLILAEESFTYQTLLEELFFDDEMLLIDRGLHYTYLEFKDETLDAFLKPTMSEGRAFLSNCRLLLVTCEQLKGATVSRKSSPIQGDGYEVAAYLNEEYHYQFLPLTCIKGLELHTRNGGQAEVKIRANPPICGSQGICGWLGSLFGVSCIKESWAPVSGPSGAEYTERILLLNVTMPPWMTPMNIKIHVNPDVQLKTFFHFVSLIQRFAPDIASSLNIIGEVDTEKAQGAADQEYSELPVDENLSAGTDQPAINVEKIKQHQLRRPLKAPKIIRQPTVGFPHGLIPSSNMVNPVYYDPRSHRVYGDFVEYDLRSIHHAIQRLPQVQLEPVETPSPEPHPSFTHQSKLSSQLTEEQKVKELIRKQDSMIGRELPVPNSEIAVQEIAAECERPSEREALPLPDLSDAFDKEYDGEETESTISVDEASLPIHSTATESVASFQSLDISGGKNGVQFLTQTAVELESEGEMMTVSLKTGKSGGYIISESQKRKLNEVKGLESSDDESQTGAITCQAKFDRKYETEIANQENNGTKSEIPMKDVAIKKKIINIPENSIRCVCSRCLNKTVEGAHWAPLSKLPKPDLCETEGKRGLKINRSGYCVCAKCLESAAPTPKNFPLRISLNI